MMDYSFTEEEEGKARVSSEIELSRILNGFSRMWKIGHHNGKLCAPISG